MKRSLKYAGLVFLPIAGIVFNAARAEYLKPHDAAAMERANSRPLSRLQLKADLSEKSLSVIQNGQVLKTYTISDGRSKYPTPRGTFYIDKVVWNPDWTPPPNAKWAEKKKYAGPGDPRNPMKLVKIFFKEPDYYIHGTDQLDDIGDAVSHGCIRMDPIEAAELAIRVMESAGANHDSTWYHRAIRQGETRTVILPERVEMTITN